MKLLKNFTSGRILTSIVVIFMMSWITLLSSCTATVRTPRRVHTSVIIEGQIPNDNHQRSNREIRRERRERQHHHDNY